MGVYAHTPAGKKKKKKGGGGKSVCMFVYTQEEIGRLCVRLSHVRKGGCNFKRAPGQGNIWRNTMNTTKRNEIKKSAKCITDSVWCKTAVVIEIYSPPEHMKEAIQKQKERGLLGQHAEVYGQCGEASTVGEL